MNWGAFTNWILDSGLIEFASHSWISESLIHHAIITSPSILEVTYLLTFVHVKLKFLS